MLLTILSALFGGLLRLAPELLKFLDAKNDRQHELDMQDKALAFQQLTGTQRINEIGSQGVIDVQKGLMDVQKAQFDAYQSAYASQAAEAAAGGKVVAFLNAVVRPLVTFGIVSLWAVHTIAVMVYAYSATGNMVDTLVNAWTADDGAMLSMILSFYFVGRTIEKKVS